ncbi:hypothetical protein XENOCAPTIV_023543 [Xenoophorus captivus]|uniref:Uncharacterized protein n=1 Tax=Xenoophorus captivus TaxID=1517983 RepID=A0ABV0RLK8_9TELE
MRCIPAAERLSICLRLCATEDPGMQTSRQHDMRPNAIEGAVDSHRMLKFVDGSKSQLAKGNAPFRHVDSVWAFDSDRIQVNPSKSTANNGKHGEEKQEREEGERSG